MPDRLRRLVGSASGRVRGPAHAVAGSIRAASSRVWPSRRSAGPGRAAVPLDPEAATPRAGARLASTLVASVLCVGLLFVTVFPTRSYLSQRAAVHKAEQKLRAINEENRRLEQEARRLSTPAEVERLARQQYGLVRPGEQAYAILPAPILPIGLPDVWPFAGVERLLGTR